MKNFDYITNPAKLLTPEIVQMVGSIHEHKGKQELFLEANIDELILIPMFIPDFLCIHPFNDGNGRMGRLLTLLLFYKAGYIVGKYVRLKRQKKHITKLFKQVLSVGMRVKTVMSLLLSII